MFAPFLPIHRTVPTRCEDEAAFDYCCCLDRALLVVSTISGICSTLHAPPTRLFSRFRRFNILLIAGFNALTGLVASVVAIVVRPHFPLLTSASPRTFQVSATWLPAVVIASTPVSGSLHHVVRGTFSELIRSVPCIGQLNMADAALWCTRPVQSLLRPMSPAWCVTQRCLFSRSRSSLTHN